MAVRVVDVVQFWYLQDLAGPHRAWGQVYQTLAFSESARPGLLHAHVTQTLAFAEDPGVSGDQSRAVTQTLAFTQGAFRNTIGYAYQNFPIAQSAAAGRGAGGGQVLAFAQHAEIVAVKGAGDTLAFREAAALAAVRARAASDTLAFTEGALVYAESPRFIAVPLPATAPAPTVILSTPAGTIVLPAPDFGNTEGLGQTRVQRNTRGGTFVIYRPAYWPTTDEFDLTFSYLSQAQADRLRALVAASVGRLCTYRDHEGRVWQVVVTNPDLVVTQAGRQNFTVPLKLLVAS